MDAAWAVLRHPQGDVLANDLMTQGLSCMAPARFIREGFGLRPERPIARMLCRAMVTLMTGSLGHVAMAQSDLSRLNGLLSTTPEGGWVLASTSVWSSAWPTGPEAVPNTVLNWTDAVVKAWSGFAWDSMRGQLVLYGGGHANYAGNEIYLWSGASGAWTRGSLPSKVDTSTADNFVVDNAAPQAAHTYDTNTYLPINDRFIAFGGNAYPLAGPYKTNIAGITSDAGPWAWNPTLADANRVGGTSGSGWNPSTLGGNMWQNRYSLSTGQTPVSMSFNQATSAYRSEGGKDVVYLTTESQASGRPFLYKVTFGNISQGETDVWQLLGRTSSTESGIYSGAATIDSSHNFFIRTAPSSTASGTDLSVWNLGTFTGSNTITDVGVKLVFADGTPFAMTTNYGMDFDAQDGRLWLWDSREAGTVYYAQPSVDALGSPSASWLITRVLSSSSSQPSVPTLTGVFGKWQYVSELGAFVGLEEFDSTTLDARVWLYKPLASVVPEPSSGLMFVVGLFGFAVCFRWRGLSGVVCHKLQDRALVGIS